MKRQILFILCVSICVLLLTGCYESEQPILDKGEKVNIDGSYEEQNRIDGSIKTVTFTEHKEGIWPLEHYSYRNQDGDVLLFKKLSSGLYLVQQNMQKEKRFEYAFIDFPDDETALMLVADFMNKWDYIEPLLKKFNIESESVSRSGATGLRLKGSNKKNIEFFDAHDKSLMTVILKLEKKNLSTTSNASSWGSSPKFSSIEEEQSKILEMVKVEMRNYSELTMEVDAVKEIIYKFIKTEKAINPSTGKEDNVLFVSINSWGFMRYSIAGMTRYYHTDIIMGGICYKNIKGQMECSQYGHKNVFDGSLVRSNYIRPEECKFRKFEKS